MFRLIFSLLIILIASGHPLSTAFADDPPLPAKKTTLQDIKSNLEEEKQRAKALEDKARELESALSETRKQMVDVGASIQDNEQRLQEIEERLLTLGAEREELESGLQEDRAAIAELVMALQRIRRVPPEALFAKPGAPLENAQSAMLLGDIIPVLNQKAQRLKNNLERLTVITGTIEQDREAAKERSEKLASEKKRLEELLTGRQTLFAQTQASASQSQKRIEEISRKARSMQDLISKLDEERTRERTRNLRRNNNVRQASATAAIPSLPPSGEAQLPISGIIKTQFNDRDAFGAPSQGIEITGRSGGLIVTPLSGKVMFSGPFKNYGRIVILEHEGGYHSLLAGLEVIHADVGQTVIAGEPLGLLKKGSSGSKPVLYYELRYGGKPVNPARKFAELG